MCGSRRWDGRRFSSSAIGEVIMPLIPVGSVEQHGLHLPEGTDSLCYLPDTARDLGQRSGESGGAHGRLTLAAAERGNSYMNICWPD